MSLSKCLEMNIILWKMCTINIFMRKKKKYWANISISNLFYFFNYYQSPLFWDEDDITKDKLGYAHLITANLSSMKHAMWLWAGQLKDRGNGRNHVLALKISCHFWSHFTGQKVMWPNLISMGEDVQFHHVSINPIMYLENIWWMVVQTTTELFHIRNFVNTKALLLHYRKWRQTYLNQK